MTKTKKVAAPVSSVGADGEQPDTKKSTKIITNPQKQINLQAAKSSEKEGVIFSVSEKVLDFLN